MWLLFALISGLFYTGSNLISRHILKGQKDAWVFSFFFSFIGAVVSIPFVLADIKFTKEILPYLVMFICGIFIVVHNWLIFRSQNFIENSLQGSVLKFRLIWAFLFGVIVLSESVTSYKIAGTALTFISGVILITKFSKVRSPLGIIYTFISTIIYGFLIIVNKELLDREYFNAQSITFLIFLFPTVINAIAIPSFKNRVSKLISTDFKFVIMSTAFGGFANLALNQALSFGEASKVLVIIESALILLLVLEHIVLKEKESVFIKFIAVILATLGAVLIRLG